MKAEMEEKLKKIYNSQEQVKISSQLRLQRQADKDNEIAALKAKLEEQHSVKQIQNHSRSLKLSSILRKYPQIVL